MAKCPKCNRRKGKRPCPVLEAPICESCCGKLRGHEIQCALDCPVFTRSEAEKKRRQAENASRLDKLREPVVGRDARAERLLTELERMVCARNRSFNDVTDLEVIDTAQEALKKVQADPDIEWPENPERTLEKMFAMALAKGVSYMRDITPEEREACVDSLVKSVRFYADEGGGSRNYVDFLMNTLAAENPPLILSTGTAEALNFLQAKRPLRAIDLLERERDACPDDAMLHHILAQAYAACERYEESFESIQKAVAINPRDIEFLFTMVMASARTGRLCGAWNVLQKALALNPPAARKTELRETETELNEVIQKWLAEHPHLDFSQFAEFERTTHAATKAITERRLDEAEGLLKEAMDIDPRCADVHCLLGETMAYGHRFDDAKKSFDMALLLEPDHEGAKRCLAALDQYAKREGDDEGVIVKP